MGSSWNYLHLLAMGNRKDPEIHLSEGDFILWGFEGVVSSTEAVRLNFLPG